MDKQSKLGILASAILDGTPVDWRAVDSTDAPDDEAVIQQLKVIAEIAAVHRSSEPSALQPAEPTPVLDRAAEHPPRWGHLQLLARVGTGTFGEVYRAWDTHLEREVALKLLRTRETSDDPLASVSDPTRVANEGRLLARVRNPNVITVYGAEPRDGSVGIWMEFIRGRTLYQIVQQQGPLGARETAGVGTELCRALAAVHTAGLLHRDVTARNVMREDGGRVVLMDFGAGHELQNGSAREGRDVTGTPLYMAPELFSGGRADQRTDIYALGVLLFHLVTGAFPVTGGSIRELTDAHASGLRTRLRDRRADLPAPFVRAVEAATASNADDRFHTMGDFEAALEHALTVPRQETRRWPLSQKLIASVAAASVVIAGALWIVRPAADVPSNGQTASAAAAGLTTRRLSPPGAVSIFSNPSDDGRYVAGMLEENGDVAIVDLVTGDYRALHMGRSDGSDGYASLGALSRDGNLVAVDWYNERDGSLRVVGTDGAPARVLVDPPGDVSVYEWSRDNTMILAALGREDGNVMALVAFRDGGIRTLRRLGDAVPQHASLSSDGRYVIYDYPEQPGALDHDLFVLDAHTGDSWPLVASPGQDTRPFWTPDQRAVLFLSNRNRNPSLWSVALENGRPTGAPRLVKDGVGRVIVRGLTSTGTVHFDLNAGFAEVYVASIDGSAMAPQPVSPRQAVSNFYPVWSRDGRYVAYSSERSIGGPGGSGAEIWVFDAESGRESRVPLGVPSGRPYGWSQDSQWILVSGPDDGRLYTVERATGRAVLVASGLERASAWGPAGIVYQTGMRAVVYDAATRRTIRTIDYSDPAIVEMGRPPVRDGRSVMARYKDGRVTLADTTTSQSWTWHDAGIEWLRGHIMAPHTRMAAYLANRKDSRGEAASLMLWGGSGEPRELLRLHDPEYLQLVGWTPDGLNLLIIRWSVDSAARRRVGNEALWRVPITGGTPVPTGLALEGLRDVSMHPNGRQITFNAGYRRVEHWVMENALPR